MFDVLCVGILVADVIAKPITDIPKKGLLQNVERIEMFSGGNAMTVALNLKTLGVKTAIVGRIGTDAFGAFLKNKLIAAGVNTQSLAEDANVQTSASIVLSHADGERSFLHCKGANARFSLEDIDWETVEQSSIVFVTGSFLMDTFDGEKTEQFLKKSKDLGKITALDVCWDSTGRWGESLNRVMPYIDIFMPSIDEAEQLSHKQTLDDMAEVFFARGVKSVVIKAGSRGCYIKESPDKKSLLISAVEGIKAIDTTGAGDSFCSGFLAALSRGKSLAECASFANAVGALNVQAVGATTGIKSYEETLRFMEEHK